MALLAGYSPEARDEVAQAQRLYPGAALVGCKFAGVLFGGIEHIWTQHLEQAPAIRQRTGRPIVIHARPKILQKRWITAGYSRDADYVWPDLHWLEGGSGFAAALWARHGMGFEMVVMCGLHYDSAPYDPAVADFKPATTTGKQLARWRELITGFIADGRAAGIYSMGGWTRQALGGPPC